MKIYVIKCLLRGSRKIDTGFKQFALWMSCPLEAHWVCLFVEYPMHPTVLRLGLEPGLESGLGLGLGFLGLGYVCRV